MRLCNNFFLVFSGFACSCVKRPEEVCDLYEYFTSALGGRGTDPVRRDGVQNVPSLFERREKTELHSSDKPPSSCNIKFSARNNVRDELVCDGRWWEAHHLIQERGVRAQLWAGMFIMKVTGKKSRDVGAFTENWSGAQHDGDDHQLDVADFALSSGSE